jgi:hypothetical protein
VLTETAMRLGFRHTAANHLAERRSFEEVRICSFAPIRRRRVFPSRLHTLPTRNQEPPRRAFWPGPASR